MKIFLLATLHCSTKKNDAAAPFFLTQEIYIDVIDFSPGLCAIIFVEGRNVGRQNVEVQIVDLRVLNQTNLT
jgi:hypothetical protein